MKQKVGFDKLTESAFRQNLTEVDIKQIRSMFLVFAVLYAVFTLFDFIQIPEYITVALIMRFVVVIPLLLLVSYLSQKDFFNKIHQQVLLISFVAGGAGIAILLILKPYNFTYYGGIFMVLFSGYFLIKLRFIYSFVGGAAILLIYIFGYLIINRNLSLIFIESTIFIIAANIIGSFGSYNTEAIKRNNFLKTAKIEEQSKILENEISVQLDEIKKGHMEVVFALAELVEARDINTGKHLESVGKNSELTAQNIRTEYFRNTKYTKEQFVRIIKLSSILHDLGKVGISDLILNKKGKLNKEEFNLIKKHTLSGSEILENIKKKYPNNEYINMGIDIVKHHHEKFDGTGYPNKLRGSKIPLSARIVCICDVYDALISTRSYKEAFSQETAIAIIKKGSGKHFDPIIVKAFLKAIEN